MFEEMLIMLAPILDVFEFCYVESVVTFAAFLFTFYKLNKLRKEALPRLLVRVPNATA